MTGRGATGRHSGLNPESCGFDSRRPDKSRDRRVVSHLALRETPLAWAFAGSNPAPSVWQGVALKVAAVEQIIKWVK